MPVSGIEFRSSSKKSVSSVWDLSFSFILRLLKVGFDFSGCTMLNEVMIHK
jgi:hypothetical protein